MIIVATSHDEGSRKSIVAFGETFVVAAGREFKLPHVKRRNGRMLASPALGAGTWYFRTATELIAIGRK